MTIIGGDAGLLLDSATGCHIRTGEYILQHSAVPRADPFSFTKNGQPWFAWEWLADLLFARIVRSGECRACRDLCDADRVHGSHRGSPLPLERR